MASVCSGKKEKTHCVMKASAYVVPVGICWFVVVKKEKPTAFRRRLRWLGSMMRVTPHGYWKHLDRVPVLGLYRDSDPWVCL